MTLKQLFNKCLTATYKTVPETQGDYKTQRVGNRLYLLLECTAQMEDWKHNFDFAAKPYKDMPKKWRAHRGFVKVWKSIIPYVENAIADPRITEIITIGYSHGAALACLAQEYIWFNRPDIRDKCYAFAFESPRVFCGWRIPEGLKERWENLYVFRNGKDIVTHVPPAIFGYKHVGTLIKIGQSRQNIVKGGYISEDSKINLKCVLEHDYPNVRNSLDEYEKGASEENALIKIVRGL